MQLDFALKMFVLLTSMLLLSFLIFMLYFLIIMFVFIFSFGGVFLTILKNRLTKDTLSHSILATQWIHVIEFFMPWDNTSLR